MAKLLFDQVVQLFRGSGKEKVKPIVSSREIRCGACRKVIEMDGWVCCPWCGKRINKYWKENSHG